MATPVAAAGAEGPGADGRELPPFVAPDASAVPPKRRRPQSEHPRELSDSEILYTLDEFLYHGEMRDFVKARLSFLRITESLGTTDYNKVAPPCLEVLEFSNQHIRTDTLLCIMHLSLGCSLGDLHPAELVHQMRQSAAVLARHSALPMLVKSLDHLLSLEPETVQDEWPDGAFERELRLVLNCIYIQTLFFGHDEIFIRSLDLPQGRLGRSLLVLLFEATKQCSENDKIPIKKVSLLLLRVLQLLLRIPEHVLSPLREGAASPPPHEPAGGVAEADEGEDGGPSAQRTSDESGPPRLCEFQAFTALQLHEQSLRTKYSGRTCPAAVKEGLEIIQRYKEEFLMNHAFHAAEVSFMQSLDFLRDAHARYEEFRERGLLVQQRAGRDSDGDGEDEEEPSLPAASDGADGAAREGLEPKALRAAVGTLGQLTGDLVETPDPQGDLSEGSSGCGSARSWASSSSTGAAGSSCSGRMSSVTAGSSTSVASSVATVVAIGLSAAGEATDGAGCALPGAASAQRRGARRRRQGRSGGGGQEPIDWSPGAVFQRLYASVFPQSLTEIVLFLLRLLLTSCSNVEKYPGVVDLFRERAATTLSSGGGAGMEDAGDDLVAAAEAFYTVGEAAEAQRHREITASAVSGILLVLLKLARRSGPEQSFSLAQLAADSNGALVVLKFLNQDIAAALAPRDALPVLPALLAPEAAQLDSMASWQATATLRLVHVLYLLCKDSPERVRRYLIHYKAPFILRRLHRIENEEMQRLVLKLLKMQVRYLPRKWKQANMRTLSAIYASVPMAPLEDWLLNEPLGNSATEGPSQLRIRAVSVMYSSSTMKQQPFAGALGGTTPAAPDPAAPAPAPTPPVWSSTAAGAAGEGEGSPSSAGAEAGCAPLALQPPLPAVGYARLFPEYLPECCR